MCAWVTLRGGEVRRYNTCCSFDEADGFTFLRANSGDREKHFCIAKIRTDTILAIEYHQPCEVTFHPTVITRAIDVLLSRARQTAFPERKRLGELARVLRDLDLRTLQWKR